jgi:hypothetical protein
MKRSLVLALFYASAGLIIFDLYAIASRFTSVNSDPVAWLKVAFAVLLQVLALGIGFLYVKFLSAYDKPHTRARLMLDTLPVRLVPVLAAGLLAAWGYTMLYNGINCGSHPLPSNRGMTTCPR